MYAFIFLNFGAIYAFSSPLDTSKIVNTNLQTDSVKIRKPLSPKKATLFSAVLPGTGQIYNRSYWKLPIIYGGFGTLIYFLQSNIKEYNFYLDQYKTSNFSDNTAFSNLEIYRRNIELNVILMAGLYVLQIIDANVDAHLSEFDVSDDLSINIKPILNLEPQYSSAGVKLSFQLKPAP